MKRFLAIVVLICTVFALVSCRKIGDGEDDEKETLDVNINAETVPEASRDTDGRKIVVLDAGHGFGDVGCTSDYIGCYEKDITLQVTLKLQAALEKKGITVILTHDGESFINEKEILSECDRLGIEYNSEKVTENENFYAYERALYSQILDAEMGVDLFVSLHVNALEQEYVSGYQLFYCDDNPMRARAVKICEDIAEGLGGEYDIIGYPEEDAYIVTKFGTFPSVLIEMGYATNPDDAAKLINDEWQNEFALLLADQIAEKVNEWNTNTPLFGG